jgi:hypothetical protein
MILRLREGSVIDHVIGRREALKLARKKGRQ